MLQTCYHQFIHDEIGKSNVVDLDFFGPILDDLH